MNTEYNSIIEKIKNSEFSESNKTPNFIYFDTGNSKLIYCKNTEIIKEILPEGKSKIYTKNSTTKIKKFIEPRSGIFQGEATVYQKNGIKLDFKGIFEHNIFKTGTVKHEDFLLEVLSSGIISLSFKDEWVWNPKKKFENFGKSTEIFSILDLDIFDGEGMKTYPNGIQEHGIWKNFQRNGKFIFKNFKTGEIAGECEYINDKRHGEGYYTTQKGIKYKGIFFNNELKEGRILKPWSLLELTEIQNEQDLSIIQENKKKFEFAEEYQGKIENKIYHGEGQLRDCFGTLYKGNFIRGSKEGKGIEEYSDGEKYEGNFSKNLPNGKGKYFCFNGDVYQGGFKDGLFHGEGQYYSKEEGKVINGVWKDGAFVEEKGGGGGGGRVESAFGKKDIDHGKARDHRLNQMVVFREFSRLIQMKKRIVVNFDGFGSWIVRRMLRGGRRKKLVIF